MYKEQRIHEKGYRINEEGEVTNPQGRKLKYRITRTGYREFLVRAEKETRIKWWHIQHHRLQAYQKFGVEIYKKGIQVRHLNGNPQDNTFENIAIGTQSDNMMDIPAYIRQRSAIIASKQSPKVYPLEKIQAIKQDRKRGMSYGALMRKYDISSKGTISYICNHEYKRFEEKEIPQTHTI